VKRASLLFIVLLVLLGAALASAAAQPAQEVKPPAPGAAGAEAGTAAAQGEHAGRTPAGVPVAGDPHGAASEVAPPAHAAPGEGKGEGTHEAEAASPWTTVARLFNFALLVGILVYLLRSPFGAFLDGRKVQIRKSLTDAAAMREEASRQLTAIDQKLAALPADLDALAKRGTAEIAAEEDRIRQTAAVERTRMLENATREIDRRGHLAERRLVRRAGELAVDVATGRLKRAITDADQRRLVDRYLEQVRPETMGS
jgi:F-type H+-transporting ATPase subunit b